MGPVLNHANQSRKALDRPNDHCCHGGAGRVHASAFRLAVQHVVSAAGRGIQDAAELSPAHSRLQELLGRPRFQRPLPQIYWNSVEVAVLVTLGQLVTCTLAAFAFARLKFPGRDSIFFVMLVGLMFPAQVTIIPIYLGFAKVGLLNRPIGLVLMYLTSSFGVFLVRQFMRSQPKALEEAALMDGAGYFKIFYRISLPQLRPALSALGIITFTQTWNYYFQARVLLEPQQSMTLPVAMDLLRGYLASGNLSVVMAAMSMAVLPVILIFLLAQKLVVEGVTMSGIKN